MKIRENDKCKTVFCTKYSHFNYQVMLFGLSNVLAGFQRYINNILTIKLDIFVKVYLDNILIYIKKSGQPQVNVIHWVLKKLWKHSFFANLKIY